MAMLEMKLFSEVYRGKRVLVTGHTGFKGSWLALWLHEMGAEVTGISLSPDSNLCHWEQLKLRIEDDHRIDIRDFDAIQKIIKENQPEIIFHLAAQPLVRQSYKDPLETWSTNVMGTANVIEACRRAQGVKAIVCITTDKCYENQEWNWGYREIDRLGGHDPYSASKAGAEIVADSFRSAFFNVEGAPLLATARAGNVVGGGDWSTDRLVPDLIRAIQGGFPLLIRSPNATRPWQHVLESLSGYLLLGQKLLSGNNSFANAWNFGPEIEGNRKVSEILNMFNKEWSSISWQIIKENDLHEATLLYLDSNKARNQLGWMPVWNIDDTVQQTAYWYRSWIESKKIITREQLKQYVETAVQKNIEWAKK